MASKRNPTGRRPGRPRRDQNTSPSMGPPANDPSHAHAVNFDGILAGTNVNGLMNMNMNMNIPNAPNANMPNMNITPNANINGNPTVTPPNTNFSTPGLSMGTNLNSATNGAPNPDVNAYIGQGYPFPLQNNPYTPNAAPTRIDEHAQLTNSTAFDLSSMYTFSNSNTPAPMQDNFGTPLLPSQTPPVAAQPNDLVNNDAQAQLIAALQAQVARLTSENSQLAATPANHHHRPEPHLNPATASPIVPIPRPKGQFSSMVRGFQIEPAMFPQGLNHDLYKQIQNSIRIYAYQVGIDFSKSYRHQHPEKLAKLFKAGRRDYPYLTHERFPDDWGQNVLLQQLIQNVQKRRNRLAAAAAAAAGATIPPPATPTVSAIGVTASASANPSALHGFNANHASMTQASPAPSSSRSARRQTAVPAATEPVAGPSNINRNRRAEDSDDDDDDDGSALYNTH